MTNLDLFKKEDLQKKYVFLQMPRVMINHEVSEYKLSVHEKFLYMLLFDRVSLSAKNNLIDENGNIYIFYTLDEICDHMDCAKTTAKKFLDSLVDKNIVMKEKQCVGRANRLYLKNICSLDTTPYNIEDKSVAKESANCEADKTLIKEPTITKAPNDKDVKLHDNTTYNNSSNCTETKESLENIKKDILESKGLPKKYLSNKKLTNLAIREMVAFDKTLYLKDIINKNSEIGIQYKETLTLFCDALTQMLTNTGFFKVGDKIVNSYDIYDLLKPFIEYASFNNEYIIDCLCSDVQSNFNKALLNDTVIKNRMKYMQTCIWNSLNQLELDTDMDLL